MGSNPAQTRAIIGFLDCGDWMAAPENRALGRGFQGDEIGPIGPLKKIFFWRFYIKHILRICLI